MEQHLYNLLLRSLDAPLPETEQRRLTLALDTSADLRAMREELVRLRTGLRTEGNESFKPFFADRVINRLSTHRQPIAEYFVAAFRSVAIGAAALVIILSVYNISRENSFTFDSALGIHHQTLEQILALETPFE